MRLSSRPAPSPEIPFHESGCSKVTSDRVPLSCDGMMIWLADAASPISATRSLSRICAMFVKRDCRLLSTAISARMAEHGRLRYLVPPVRPNFAARRSWHRMYMRPDPHHHEILVFHMGKIEGIASAVSNEVIRSLQAVFARIVCPPPKSGSDIPALWYHAASFSSVSGTISRLSQSLKSGQDGRIRCAVAHRTAVRKHQEQAFGGKCSKDRRMPVWENSLSRQRPDHAGSPLSLPDVPEGSGQRILHNGHRSKE